MILHPGIKVNIGLDILRKRPDGYHDIETLFVPCADFHDTLEIVPADEPSTLIFDLLRRHPQTSAQASASAPDGPVSAGPAAFVSDAPVLRQAIRDDGKVMMTVFRKDGVDWDPLRDLCVKAYRLLEADFGLPAVKIVLEKGSPVGAGLGGGSADAACTLKALNERFSLGLDDASLAAYAARLGSDCAFFVYNRPMLGSGRGEVLADYPMEDFFGRYEIKVYVPEGIAVSTAQAYAGVTPCIPERPLVQRLAEPVARWKDVLVNAFEPGIVRLYPELATLKDRIYADGALYAAMSGSGSAFFGLFERQ